MFWAADVRGAHGFSMNCQRNVFHARWIFSLDWVAGLGFWKNEKNSESFAAVSVCPVFRFTAVHSKPADVYFNCTLAGPTIISRTIIDGENTGRRFPFQDPDFAFLEWQSISAKRRCDGAAQLQR